MVTIRKILAREVLDSRGFPTVEVEMHVAHPKHAEEVLEARAIVPSGASTGEGEALEMRDGDTQRFLGKGVKKAVQNVQEKIAPALVGKNFTKVSLLDDLLKELDGTENKAVLGANAILGVSMAFVRAQSLVEGVQSYQLIAKTLGTAGTTLPVPLMNILNGGKHADNSLAIQEFMIVPAGFKTFSESLRAGVEIFHHLKKILHSKGLSTAVGDEGGFAPVFEGGQAHEQALNVIMQAIGNAGYRAGKEVFLALDAAASEFCEVVRSKNEGQECLYQFEGKSISSQAMVDQYQAWVKEYPIISIEDGLSEHDWAGWKKLTETIGKTCQLVGDDLFVTNPVYLKKGIENQIGNSVLIKLNQIGTVTETLETIKMAHAAGYTCITSHRSGETEDVFIAELAVGTDCGQIKTGSASRTDRLAKYNQLLRIEERLGERAKYAGMGAFRRG